MFPHPTTSLVELNQQSHHNQGSSMALSSGNSSNITSPCGSRPSTPGNFFSPYAVPNFPVSPSGVMGTPVQNPMMAFQTPPPTPPPISNGGFFVNSRIMPPLSPYNQPLTNMNGYYYPPPVNSIQERTTEFQSPARNNTKKEKYEQGNSFDCESLNISTCERSEEMDGIKAVVEEEGYISLHLNYNVTVDISPDQGIRVINHRKGITLSLSGCGTSMALVHPQGRALQYNSRIEVQTQDKHNYRHVIKNAKMWPRGVSFTANNYALVYLVDQAGARSTTDSFHDLYASNIAESIFIKTCEDYHYSGNTLSSVDKSIQDLENAAYWRTEGTNLDCWVFDNVKITQTPDGLVTVERRYGEEVFTLKTSPSNGKARLQSSFMYLTASMGEESHIFVKSNDRRIHYNGKAFVVRNAGHSAGFDEDGQLRIW